MNSPHYTRHTINVCDVFWGDMITRVIGGDPAANDALADNPLKVRAMKVGTKWVTLADSRQGKPLRVPRGDKVEVTRLKHHEPFGPAEHLQTLEAQAKVTEEQAIADGKWANEEAAKINGPHDVMIPVNMSKIVAPLGEDHPLSERVHVLADELGSAFHDSQVTESLALLAAALKQHFLVPERPAPGTLVEYAVRPFGDTSAGWVSGDGRGVTGVKGYHPATVVWSDLDSYTVYAPAAEPSDG